MIDTSFLPLIPDCWTVSQKAFSKSLADTQTEPRVTVQRRLILTQSLSMSCPPDMNCLKNTRTNKTGQFYSQRRIKSCWKRKNTGKDTYSFGLFSCPLIMSKERRTISYSDTYFNIVVFFKGRRVMRELSNKQKMLANDNTHKEWPTRRKYLFSAFPFWEQELWPLFHLTYKQNRKRN